MSFLFVGYFHQCANLHFGYGFFLYFFCFFFGFSFIANLQMAKYAQMRMLYLLFIDICCSSTKSTMACVHSLSLFCSLVFFCVCRFNEQYGFRHRTKYISCQTTVTRFCFVDKNWTSIRKRFRSDVWMNEWKKKKKNRTTVRASIVTLYFAGLRYYFASSETVIFHFGRARTHTHIVEKCSNSLYVCYLLPTEKSN